MKNRLRIMHIIANKSDLKRKKINTSTYKKKFATFFCIPLRSTRGSPPRSASDRSFSYIRLSNMKYLFLKTKSQSRSLSNVIHQFISNSSVFRLFLYLTKLTFHTFAAKWAIPGTEPPIYRLQPTSLLCPTVFAHSARHKPRLVAPA